MQNSCVIYSDNGIDLVRKVIPRIIGDFFGRDYMLRYLVIKDSDGNPSDTLNEAYYNSINDVLSSKRHMTKYESYLNNPNSCIKFVSQTDPDYKAFVKMQYIPKSIERMLLDRGVEIYSNSISRSFKRNLYKLPIHSAIDSLAVHIDKTKESFYRTSVADGWFIEEEWYQKLIQEIQEFLNVDLLNIPSQN